MGPTHMPCHRAVRGGATGLAGLESAGEGSSKIMHTSSPPRLSRVLQPSYAADDGSLHSVVAKRKWGFVLRGASILRADCDNGGGEDGAGPSNMERGGDDDDGAMDAVLYLQ